ncbi:MAG: DUF4446 family protein [Candidatus Moranbacteria bacterium]|nr:DUF4446 family protein [Candidatus Moranbacteria bacterium]
MQDGLIFLLIFGIIISFGSIGLSVFLLLRIKKLQEFFDRVFGGGSEVKDLEKTMIDLSEKNKKLDQDIEDLFDAINQVNDLTHKSINRIGFVRFNPFDEKGGRKDCFALALLNGKRTGFVISSLATQTGNKVFVKKIEKNKPDVPLSQEESQAVSSAK